MIRTAILIIPLALLAGCVTPADVADQQCHHYLDNLNYKAYSACYDVAFGDAANRQAQVSQALIQQGAAMQAAAQANRPVVTTTNCQAYGGGNYATCTSVQH